MRDRAFARNIAKHHFHRTRPTEWFDVLHRAANGDSRRIPWADERPDPNLAGWKETHVVRGSRAIVVGCGLGDNAEEVARWGLDTVAFDISPEAVEWCRRRFPGSPVAYTASDLFALPKEWICAFDFVLEIYTIQSLPPEHRARIMEAIASMVALQGNLLTISRGRDHGEPPGGMPWPLTRSELQRFASHGLRLLEFEDYMGREEPPVRRFRALWRRETE